MKTRKTPILSEAIKKIRMIMENNPNARLPSVRNLARQCAVSPVTALRAIAILKSEGVLEGGWGRVSFIVGKKSLEKRSDDYQSVNKAKKTVLAIKNDVVEGRYQTHLPLPPIKQLTALYNVSYPTVKKALALLTDENIVKRSGVRYYFFTDQAKPKSKIAIVAFGLGRNSVKIVTERERDFYRLLSAVAIDHRAQMEMVCYNDYLENPRFYTPNDTALMKYLKNGDIAGIILSSYHMKDSAECLRKLLPFNIPISAWVEDHRILKMIGLYDAGQRKLSFFDSTYSTIPGFEVGSYLIGKGHKNIAYISPFHESPWSQNRLTGLKKAAASNPNVRVYPFVCTKFSTDYFFLEKVLKDGSFDKHCSVPKIVGKLQPFLQKRISSVKYEHDILLRDSKIFTVCAELTRQASKNNSITAWVCANDLVAVLITDYWNHSSFSLAKRPALIGFDNSFQSFERDITSYEFNTRGEIQHMLDHLLYPNSSFLINGKPAIRLSGRIIERTSSAAANGSIESMTNYPIL